MAMLASRPDYDTPPPPAAKGDGAVPEELRGVLTAFVGELEKEKDRRIGRKEPVEQRWLRNLRQYHGIYEDDVLVELKKEKKSQLFVNVTRPKTNAGAARISDMMFPTDDKNWGITPTPVPDLMVQMEQGDSQAKAAAETATRLSAAGRQDEAEAVVAKAQTHAKAAADARRVVEAAQASCRAMELEIEDQLRECLYASAARIVIDEAAQIGTGIIKGPVRPQRPKSRWTNVPSEGGGLASNDNSAMQLVAGPDYKGAAYRTSPWHFFPDPDATEIADGDGTFERHLLNKKQVRRLARMPGFDRAAVQRLLQRAPTEPIPTFLADLRNITGIQNSSASDVFHVWEYYGEVAAQQLRDIALALGQEDMANDYDDADELDEISVCIWFCQGEILKFSEHTLDSCESLYSAFCWQKDAESIWGYGIPHIMEDSQRAINAAWRMMFDNAGLSTGPQILIHQSAIEPANGLWTLEPRKLWYLTRVIAPGERVMETFEIPSHQAELMAIVKLVREIIDEETGISQLAQGEQGAGVTKTAQGMAILMNSSNVVMRRIVKAFDDGLTTTLLRRFYHWNMQFNPKRSVKGDYEVVARGSSVLLEREVQGANLMGIVTTAAGHPVLGPLTKIPDAYRKAIQASKIAADDIVKTDDQIEQDAAERAANPPPPDPQMVKLEVMERIAKLESDSRERVAELNHETAMMRATQDGNVKLDEARVRSADAQAERDARERAMAVEAAMADATGQSAGGSV